MTANLNYRCGEDAKKGDRNGVYIPQAEKTIAEKLAQNTYNEKVLQCAQRRLNQIRKIVRDYEDNEIERIMARFIQTLRFFRGK